MNHEASERLNSWMVAQRLDALLISTTATLTWLSGYAPPIEWGSSPFEGGPALGLVAGGQLVALASDAEAPKLRAQGVETHEYAAYTVDAPLHGVERQAAALAALIRSERQLVGRVGRIGIEADTLPARLLHALTDAAPEAALVPVDAELTPLRAIKTAEEIDKLRAALRLCDTAQAYLRTHRRAGITEIALWGETKGHLEGCAGERIPAYPDLAGGQRTENAGGLPGSYTLREGDPLIFDIAARYGGYWGDNCATYFVGMGERASALEAAHRAVAAVLRQAIEAVRPGLRACDLDQQVRAWIAAEGYAPYPHHTGHGIGASFHEEPRIVSYNTTPLTAGMVIALEPGIYLPGVGGVRLEHALLVTADGCEVLTQHLVEVV